MSPLSCTDTHTKLIVVPPEGLMFCVIRKRSVKGINEREGPRGHSITGTGLTKTVFLSRSRPEVGGLGSVPNGEFLVTFCVWVGEISSKRKISFKQILLVFRRVRSTFILT